jgi:PKD repeat protein
MPSQILKPVGGLNIDTDAKYLTPVQYKFAKNHYYGINENTNLGTGADIAQGNNEAVVTPAPSNIQFAPLTLPDGINQNIGAFEFRELGEVYFFNWNSNGNNGIYRLNIEAGTIDKVKEGIVLPFDIRHPIAEHNVHLRLAYNSPLIGATPIWKWLIWTDGNEWQGFVDVETAVATDGYNANTYPYFKKFAPHCDESEFFQLGVRPHFYCPQVSIVTDNTEQIMFSVQQNGTIVQFTDESGGSSWIWDFGDDTGSTFQNPQHLYLEAGEYDVTLTIDGESHTETITVYDGMQALFGTALNNIGTYWDDYSQNQTWRTFIGLIKFLYGSYTAGSEDHWLRWVSKRGGFDLVPNNESLTTVIPRVGMGANSNEIYYQSAATGTNCINGDPNNIGGAVCLQDDYNNTGIDYFTATSSYVTAQRQVFIFTPNVAHGEVVEMAFFIDYLIAQGTPFIIRYGNEQSIGSTGTTPGTAQTSDEYLAKVADFDDYMASNHPNVPRIICAADHDRTGWDNDDIAAFAVDRGIPYFTTYFWIGDLAGSPNTNTNIDLYFVQSIYVLRDSTASGNNSLYGEIMPRLIGYATTFSGLKCHVGQYGVSLQRSGYAVMTILHGLLLWNEIFEFLKYNDDNGVFIKSMVFLENETCVSPKVGADFPYTIDNAFVVEDEDGNVFIKRVPGVAMEMLNDLPNFNGNPLFITMDISGSPDKFDAIAYQLDTRIIIYVYNYDDSDTDVVSIEFDGDEIGLDIDLTTIWGEKIYASIGNSPANTYFKNNGFNVGLLPANVQRFSGLISSNDFAIKKHSITKIEIVTEQTPTTIKLNFA